MASLFRDTAHSGPRRRRAHAWAYLRIALAMALAFLMLPSAGLSASAEEPTAPDAGTVAASTATTPGDAATEPAEGEGSTPPAPAEEPTPEEPAVEGTEQTEEPAPADPAPADPEPVVEKAEPKVQKSAPAPKSTEQQDAPQGFTAMTSGSDDATITVRTGGVRTGSSAISPLAGVKLRLQDSDGDAIAASWAACTSQANGTCTFTVPKKQINWPFGTTFRVVQVAAPSGWYQNGSLLTGERSFSSTDYSFPVKVRRGDDLVSTADFMKADDNSNGERSPDRDASNGVWQDSLANPALPQRCVTGLDVALVLDRSGSVGNYMGDLKQSAKGFVDALAGTGSAVAVYSFADGARKDLDLTELDAGSNLQTVKAAIDAQHAFGGTNWDRGLWKVASDSKTYDLAIVITDGNPTFYGDRPNGPGDFTSFKEMEEAIFSANAIKAEGTRLLAVGVGDGVSGDGANLRAVSGPTKANGGPAEAADYFQTDWNNLATLLDEIADGYTCEAAITVQKRVVTPGGNPAGTPAAGWQFTAQVTDGPAVLDGPATTTTGADGTTQYWLEYDRFTDEADVRITETAKPDWNIDRAVCKVNGNAVATPLSGSSFTVPGIGREDSVDCVVYNVQEPAPTLEVTKTATPDEVPETGGRVTYTVAVKNTSGERLRLTSLTDDLFGNLFAGSGNTQIDGEDCQSGRLIAAGATYTCTFEATVTGDAGDEHTNVVTAVAVDDDGTLARDEDDTTVTFTDVAPTVEVTKSAAPGSVPESGGDVRFTVGVKNSSHEKVWLTELVDDPFGDLLDDAGNDQISGSTCVAAAAGIAPGTTYTCAFTARIDGLDAGDEHVDTVTGTVEDNDGSEVTDSARATVTVTDVPPTVKVTKTAAPVTVPETGGSVLYTVDVKNTSFETVTLESLDDDAFGDLLDGDNDAVEASTCTAGTEILPGATYTCSFTASVTGLDAGEQHVNVVTATVRDDDESTASDSDDATVTATDVKPAIEVTKTADPGSVSEPGAEVTYTVTVDNTGLEEVALTDLVDDTFGDLFEGTDPAVSQSTCEPTRIAGLGSYTCEFDAMVTGDAGDQHVNVVTATAFDNEENRVTDSDDATVTITDVKPVVTTLKTADPTSVDEPGDEVTYTVSIANESTFEAVELSSLLDTMYDGGAGFGDLLDPDNDLRGNTCNDPREADADATVSIEAGGSYDCTFTALVEGDAGDTHHNVVTAVVVDDGDEITTSDDAEVKVEDVLPTIEVTKTADPVSVPEPSAEISYRVAVKNTSREPVALTALVDSAFGDLLDDAGNDLVTGSTCDRVMIPAGVTYQCGFEAVASGDVRVPHVNIVTATAYDDEENQVTDSDTATVEFTDVLPTIEVTKTADRASVPESGGQVTYTVAVRNTSPEDLMLVGISDDRFGSLLWGETEGVDENLCLAEDLDRSLAPGETVTCTFTARIAGNAGTDHTNVVTVRGVDNEENSARDTDDETVTFTDVLPTVEVTKTADVASVPESGGEVTYDVTVENTSWEPVTLTDLVDDTFGDLLDGDNDAVSSSSCEVGQVIAAGSSYACSFTATIEGLDAGDEHVNTVTATVVDDDESTATDKDRETVEITDVAPTVEVTKSAASAVREPGGVVSYVVTVENTSWEPVTLTDLVDDTFGDLLDADNDAVEASTCTAGVEIAPGDVYTCSFDATVSGNAGFVHTNVVTATVVDDDESTATDDDDATVTVSDEAPVIDVTKAADVESVPETGGDVTYTVGVRNDSIEPVTLTSLVDDRFGDLLDDSGNDLVSDSTCVAGTEIAVGTTYTCTFGAVVTGNAGVPHVNVVTGIAVDDEGGEASDVATATVGITDVAPEIELTKTADVAFLDAPGGEVTYTVTVENTGSEAVSLVSLVDDRFGDLLGGSALVLDSTCVAGTTIEVGETYACTFTADVLGTTGFHVNVVTGTVVDDDGTEAVDTADASVAFNEVLGVEEERPVGERPERPTPGALRPATGILPETGSGRAVLGLGLLGSLMVALGAGTVLTRRRRSI